MKTALLAFGSALVFCPSLLAGDAKAKAPFPHPRHSREGRIAFTSNNVQLMDWRPLSDFAGGNTSGADCWGYTSPSGREYAIIGLSHGIGFVEVTDPGDTVMVDYEPGGFDSLWQSVKVYGNYAYAGSEGGFGIRVFNLTNIDSAGPNRVTLQTTILTGGCSTATHTMDIDEVSGFLYRCGGQGCFQGLNIYSLANPASPAFVGSWNTRYVHEAQVETWDVAGPHFGKQIALCFTEDSSGGGNPRLQILDVTNKAAIVQLSSTSYTGGQFSHQGWTTANKQHLYLNDELDDGSFGGARTRVFSISNLAAPSYLGWFTSGASSIDHNLYVKGNQITESNYRSGLRVFDNTASATAPTQIGFFDTWPEDDAQDFNSLWSNYPFFASGTVIGGDIEKGLFVWRVGPRKLTFDFVGGVPEMIGPGGGSVQFTVTEDTPGDLQAGTVTFHFSTGGPFTDVNATSLGGDLYEAVMPSVPCGAEIDFYLSAQSSDDATWTDPPAGTTQVYIATAAYAELVDYTDNMETNTGWLVNQAGDLTGFSTASTGTWTRVNPIGTAAQPEDDHSNPGTFCWVTGQGTVGGGLGDADVDGGATSLRSAVLDASGLTDPFISYWRWYSNAQNGVIDDQMTIDISNNGGSSWVNVETLGPSGQDSLGGWIRHTARIADFVAPTNNMRLRLRASDLGTGSIVEAGIDDLQIVEFDCTPPAVTIESIFPTSGPSQGGNLVTITGSGFQPGVTVQFGQATASVVNVINPSTLEVVVPRIQLALPTGAKTFGAVVDVTVQNPGSDMLEDAYRYIRPSPTPTSF